MEMEFLSWDKNRIPLEEVLMHSKVFKAEYHNSTCTIGMVKDILGLLNIYTFIFQAIIFDFTREDMQ